MRRIFLVAAMAILGTACLTSEMSDDDVTVPDLGHGSGSNLSLTALVTPTPRDHNLEYMVGVACMGIVLVPSMRRRDDRSGRA